MGLGNPDHVMVHEACLQVREEQPDREWFCYEDHGYKHMPGAAGLAGREVAALAPLADARHRPARARRGAQAPRHLVLHVADPTARARPRCSVARMEGRVPEQFWRLAPPPQGWEGLADFV